MKIIVRIQGGLGNQISQYVFSRYLSVLYPNAEIKVDISWFESHADRRYQLEDAFENSGIVLKYTSTDEVNKVTGIKRTELKKQKLALRIRNHLIRQLQEWNNRVPYIIQDISKGYQVDRRIYSLNEKNDWYLDGTWQDIDYADIVKQIQNELVFKLCLEDILDKEWRDFYQNNFLIAVHFRYGDYLNNGNPHNILENSNYYKNAVRIVKERYSNCKFIVFSDDLARAGEIMKSMLNENEFRIAPKNDGDDWKDMFLISKCKGFICANSTFSYWGAMLGYNKNQIFLFPEYYTINRKSWNSRLFELVPLQ